MGLNCLKNLYDKALLIVPVKEKHSPQNVEQVTKNLQDAK